MLAKALAAALVFWMAAAPAMADDFKPVHRQSDFLSLISGRHLIRTGIKLAVSASGKIEGSAFGRSVSGDWAWDGKYFCRDLYYGTENLGANCQAVMVRGDTLRFISDQGAGEFADLRLR